MVSKYSSVPIFFPATFSSSLRYKGQFAILMGYILWGWILTLHLRSVLGEKITDFSFGSKIFFQGISYEQSMGWVPLFFLCFQHLNWRVNSGQACCSEAQTQGISKLAAVAAGSDQLAWGKHATTLVILTQFKSQEGSNACKYQTAIVTFFFMWNEIDQKINSYSMKLAKNCCWPKQRPLLSSIFLSGIGLWVNIWHRNKTNVLNWILCKAAGLNHWQCPVCVCSNSNGTAQLLQMAAHKCLETMSGMILNQLQPKFAAKWHLMFESIVVTSVDKQASIFDLKIFFSNLPL